MKLYFKFILILILGTCIPTETIDKKTNKKAIKKKSKPKEIVIELKPKKEITDLTLKPKTSTKKTETSSKKSIEPADTQDTDNTNTQNINSTPDTAESTSDSITPVTTTSTDEPANTTTQNSSNTSITQTQTSTPVVAQTTTSATTVQPTTNLTTPTAPIAFGIFNNTSDTITINNINLFPGSLYYNSKLTSTTQCSLYANNSISSSTTLPFTLTANTSWFGGYISNSNNQYISGIIDYSVTSSANSVGNYKTGYISNFFTVPNQNEISISFNTNGIQIFSQDPTQLASCSLNNSCGQPAKCSNNNPTTDTGSCGCSNYPDSGNFKGSSCTLNWKSNNPEALANCLAQNKILSNGACQPCLNGSSTTDGLTCSPIAQTCFANSPSKILVNNTCQSCPAGTNTIDGKTCSNLTTSQISQSCSSIGGTFAVANDNIYKTNTNLCCNTNAPGKLIFDTVHDNDGCTSNCWYGYKQCGKLDAAGNCYCCPVLKQYN